MKRHKNTSPCAGGRKPHRQLRRVFSAGSAAVALATAFAASAQAADPEKLEQELEEAKAEIAELRSMVEALVAENRRKTAVIEPIGLEERVDELEEIALEQDEKLGDRAVVKAFDGATFDIGGFFDSTASVVIGEDGTTASYNKQIFELLFHTDLGPRWDLFVAQAFVRNAPLTFTDPDGVRSPAFGNNNSPVVTDTVIAWGQYHHSDALNLQFGRYITPIGIINVEHFPATLLDTDQPMFLRPFPGQTLYANFMNGVNVHGRFYTGSKGQNTLEYSLFGGVWAGNSTNYSAGGRLRYNIDNTGLSLGLNALTGDRSSTQTSDRFGILGADLLFDKGPIIFKTEYFYSSEDAGGDKQAFYIQPGYRLTPKLTSFYRFDYFDEGGIAAPRKEHVFGVVYDPISNVRLRLIYRRNAFEDAAGVIEAGTDTIQFKSTLNF